MVEPREWERRRRTGAAAERGRPATTGPRFGWNAWQKARFNPSVRRARGPRPVAGAWRWGGRTPGAMSHYGWQYRGAPERFPATPRRGERTGGYDQRAVGVTGGWTEPEGSWGGRGLAGRPPRGASPGAWPKGGERGPRPGSRRPPPRTERAPEARGRPAKRGRTEWWMFRDQPGGGRERPERPERWAPRERAGGREGREYPRDRERTGGRETRERPGGPGRRRRFRPNAIGPERRHDYGWAYGARRPERYGWSGEGRL